MKRIIILLAVLLGIGNAYADGVLSLSDLDATKSYYVCQGTKGYLYANGGKACTDGKTTATADDAHRWAVVYSDKLGAYFLYNLKDSTFLSTANSECPLTEAAAPVYLFDAPQKGAWYAYTSGGVVGLNENTAGGAILLQGENAAMPDALSFETAGTLSDGHRTKIEAAAWLAVTQQTAVPVISNIGTRISSLSEITDGASFLLYSTGMSKYVYDAGSALSFGSSAPAKNNLTAMPYVFTFHKTGDTYTIETGITGNYISGLSGSTVATGEEPTTFTVTASSTAGSFNLYNPAASQYINAQSAKPVGWGESEGNSRYQLIPVTLASSDKYYPVTYICYETDGEHNRLMDVQTYAKSTNRLSAPTFTGYKRLSIKSSDGVTSATSSVTEPTVVYVFYERNLRSQPVVPTTISGTQFADTTRWYTLSIDRRYLQYQADAAGHYYLNNTELQTLDDASLWCFVGNNVDGYRLYNRAAGATLSLTLKDEPQNTDLPFLTEGRFPYWAISNGSTSGTWYISPVGTKNTVFLADDGQRKLSVMASGASIVIDEAAVVMQDFAADAAVNLGTDVGKYNAASAASLVSAANAYTLKESAFANLQQAYNAFRSGADRVTIDRSCLYRIVNANSSATLTAPIEATTLTAAEEAQAARDQLWRILPVGSTGSYYVLNPENGNFLGLTSGTSGVSLLAEPTTHAYNISNPSNGLSTWLLKDGGTSNSTSYISLTDEGIVTGGKNTAETAAWRIVPVERFTIETKGTGAIAATTVFLPFSVSLPGNLTAAAITAKGEESITIETLADGIIPAYTPALVISDEPGSFTLTATTDAGILPESNLLIGVDKRTTIEGAQTFVLGEASQFVAGDGTLAAYTAYLDRETTEAAALAIMLPTGINTLIFNNATGNGLWYDLEGRPVDTPVRPGIFIRNGRKIIVK